MLVSAIPREALEEAARQVAEVAGLDLVVLFGSAATGARAHPEDLDIAVRAREGAVNLLALTDRFAALLGSQDVDLVDLRRADPLMLMLVARDGVVLFERESSTFAQFTSLAVRRFADARKFRDAEREEIRAFIRAAGTAS